MIVEEYTDQYSSFYTSEKDINYQKNRHGHLPDSCPSEKVTMEIMFEFHKAFWVEEEKYARH